MATLLRIIDVDDHEVTINLDKISFFMESDGETYFEYIDGGCQETSEPYDSVLKRVEQSLAGKFTEPVRTTKETT